MTEEAKGIRTVEEADRHLRPITVGSYCLVNYYDRQEGQKTALRTEVAKITAVHGAENETYKAIDAKTVSGRAFTSLQRAGTPGLAPEADRWRPCSFTRAIPAFSEG